MMRKLTLLLLSLAILGSCGKKDEVKPKPEPLAVDKTVVFEVFASKDYSTGYYADHEARIYLSLRRTDKVTFKETIVFDTTFTKKLKEIPLETNPLIINKKLPGVIDQNEWIGIGSGARVGAVGYGGFESFPENQTEKNIEVVL